MLRSDIIKLVPIQVRLKELLISFTPLVNSKLNVVINKQTSKGHALP